MAVSSLVSISGAGPIDDSIRLLSETGNALRPVSGPATTEIHREVGMVANGGAGSFVESEKMGRPPPGKGDPGAKKKAGIVSTAPMVREA